MNHAIVARCQAFLGFVVVVDGCDCALVDSCQASRTRVLVECAVHQLSRVSDSKAEASSRRAADDKGSFICYGGYVESSHSPRMLPGPQAVQFSWLLGGESMVFNLPCGRQGQHIQCRSFGCAVIGSHDHEFARIDRQRGWEPSSDLNVASEVMLRCMDTLLHTALYNKQL